MKFVDKDLLSVQEARILMEHAGEAKKALALYTQEKLDSCQRLPEGTGSGIGRGNRIRKLAG